MSIDHSSEAAVATTLDDVLDVDSLLRVLSNMYGDFPRDELALVKRNWETLAPHFIDALWRAAREPDAVIDEESMLHEYAFRLAAEMRDTRAFAPLVAILQLPADTRDSLVYDGLTDCFDRALASTFDGDDTSLREIAGSFALDWQVRIAAVSALAIRAHQGDADRSATVAWVHSFAAAEAAAISGNDAADTTCLELLISVLVDFRAVQYLPDISAWYAGQLADVPYYGTIESVHEELARPYDDQIRTDQFHSYGDHLLEEFSTWALFTDADDPFDRFDARTNFGATVNMPVVRDGPKIGRNDRCPCGSGLKFKKCCGVNG